MRIAPLLATTLLAVASAQSAEFYVCAATGKGKAATREEPAKDLGNLIQTLKPGDTVHIAEGVYTGRADCGADMITVPVRIIGGYSPDFAKRDPWARTAPCSAATTRRRTSMPARAWRSTARSSRSGASSPSWSTA